MESMYRNRRTCNVDCRLRGRGPRGPTRTLSFYVVSLSVRFARSLEACLKTHHTWWLKDKDPNRIPKIRKKIYYLLDEAAANWIWSLKR